MQAAPAAQFLVRRFAVWNVMLTSLCVAAVVSCVAWFVGRRDDLPVWSVVLMVAACLMALAGAWASHRRHPVRLRWDSEHWYLAELNGASAEAGPAHVHVKIDAGAWLLLKFVPQGSTDPLKVRWLPVQRRGVEGQWHALRCAVYSPRADVTRPLGLDGPIRFE